MARFTAADARARNRADLDVRIKAAVEDGNGSSASLRIYHDDWFFRTIEEELLERGFINIDVPDIVLSGDVHFEWTLKADD